MTARPLRYAAAILLASATSALSAPTCKQLAAESARLQAEMGAIGEDVAATANARAARRQGAAATSMIVQGIGQFVPMGGMLGQGIDLAKRADALSASAAMEQKMSRMRTASARLTAVETQRASRCGE